MLRKIIIVTVVFIVLLGMCLFSNNTETLMNTNKVQAEEEHLIEVYAANGRTLKISIYELSAYLKVGWYEVPVQNLWHRTNYYSVIAKSEVDLYLQSGEWYESIPAVNYSDQLLLAKTIYAEATENPSLRYQDRTYVGAVVMNRLRSGYWGNSLRNVIYAPGQYACVGTKKFNSTPPQECMDIARALLLGERYGVPDNVIFQAQFIQGRGVWKKVGVHYYCYK